MDIKSFSDKEQPKLFEHIIVYHPTDPKPLTGYMYTLNNERCIRLDVGKTYNENDLAESLWSPIMTYENAKGLYEKSQNDDKPKSPIKDKVANGGK